jgi:hypothetical protein
MRVLGCCWRRARTFSNVSTAPTVDGLVFVAHNAKVAVLEGEVTDQLVLRPVRVLVLVDHHVSEAIAVGPSNVGELIEQQDSLAEEIVEIQSVGLLETLFIAGIHTCGLFPVGLKGILGHLFRPDPLALRRTDARRDETRLDVFDSKVLYKAFDHLQLIVGIVNREITRIPEHLYFSPQQPHAQRMKRRDPGIGRPPCLKSFAHTGLHLICGLVGKRDCQNRLGPHTEVVDHVNYPVGDYARLATARPGENQNGPIDGLRRLQLLGV